MANTPGFLLILAILRFSSACPATETNRDLKFRLPTNIVPLHYDITLQPDLRPDLNPAQFNGSVTIRLKPTEDTRTITLQIRKLIIYDNSVSIETDRAYPVEIEDIAIDNENEFYIITTKEDLLHDEEYVLYIGSYDGILHLDNAGFYLAKYMEDGVEKRFATTQFQSTNARRAFPCFDEPSFKATFTISMIRPSHFNSISNEILRKAEDLGNGFTIDRYRETVLMSTYLVAFVVSQYDHIAKEDQRVFARPQAVEDGWCEYALATGLKTMYALEEYLGVEYTLDKMDQVAIPDVHFSPGAMENWGLVTYRESYLLYSQEHSTSQQMQKIATVIAHEFAHQWFGNLVTLQWWKYTWLNEGFATYFEMFGASLVETTWRLMEQFVFDVHDALEFDSTDSTTPMNYETPYGSGAPTLITYDKGGSVIRMAEHFLTKDVFRKSLNVYLKQMQFMNSVPEDLYSAIQATVDMIGSHGYLGGLTVAEILAPWTDQEGYPVVSVTRDYETGIVTLAQKRFMLKTYEGQNMDLLWPIPINFMFSSVDKFDFSDTKADRWFTTQTETLPETFPTEGFVIANKQQTGYYRVNYDSENWNRIIDYLMTESYENIIPINRAQLIDDAFNFAKSGLISYDIALNLSKYVIRETDYIPLKTFLKHMEFLKQKLFFSNASYKFKSYLESLLSHAAVELGFHESETDDHVTKLNRVQVISQRCNLADMGCRLTSLALFREWRYSNASISPNMQQYVFCTAMRDTDMDDRNYLYTRYLEEEVEFLKLRMLNALGCVENESFLHFLMEQVVYDNSPIRESDMQTAFTSIYTSGVVGLDAAFQFLSYNFDSIKSSPVNVNSLINGIAAKLNTASHRDELIDLAERYGHEYFDAAITTVEENIAWSDQYLPGIVDWLEMQETISKI